jgi:cytochrome c oxidase subunit 2
MTARAVVLVLALMSLAAGSLSRASAEESVIRISAKKFEYSQREIVLQRGVPVVLELTALDRVHGFNAPDLGMRADLVPGQVTWLRFTPAKAGTFVFFCDVFCGDGHEEMSGMLVVKD